MAKNKTKPKGPSKTEYVQKRKVNWILTLIMFNSMNFLIDFNIEV